MSGVTSNKTIVAQSTASHGLGGGGGAPFLHAPEGARTIYLVTAGAACGPLVAGTVLFGWRSLVVAVVTVLTAAAVERAYYRITRTPALFGRSHAYLTGLLLALTLPPFTPWYVAMAAAAFAIIVGKAIFGGVGHFLWQPALVGRLAVAVMFSASLQPVSWPVLSQNRLLVGDIDRCRAVDDYRGWQGRPAPAGADGFVIARPETILAGLTTDPPAFCALAYRPADSPSDKGPVLRGLPPINDLLLGTTPGGIGETCAVVIIVAGVYLIYRGYVKWQLPVFFVLAAWVTTAIAPIRLAGAGGAIVTAWWPLSLEGLDVGVTYIHYQFLSGELLLAAFFLATEMTSRPVTAGGQALFGAGCGILAMLLKLYLAAPIPCYLAVLGMNTFTPLIDAVFTRRGHGRISLRIARTP
jgi:electron transport complex protein RnfD